jgi:hypothetical protein
MRWLLDEEPGAPPPAPPEPPAPKDLWYIGAIINVVSCMLTPGCGTSVCLNLMRTKKETRHLRAKWTRLCPKGAVCPSTRLSHPFQPIHRSALSPSILERYDRAPWGCTVRAALEFEVSNNRPPQGVPDRLAQGPSPRSPRPSSLRRAHLYSCFHPCARCAEPDEAGAQPAGQVARARGPEATHA